MATYDQGPGMVNPEQLKLQAAERTAYNPDQYIERQPPTQSHERFMDTQALEQLQQQTPGAIKYSSGLETTVSLPYSAVPPELRIFHLPRIRVHIAEATHVPTSENRYILKPAVVDKMGAITDGVKRNYYVEVGRYVRLKKTGRASFSWRQSS